MSEIQALILGIVQGITEFLPISSSGHLVLVESLLNLPVETLKSFDVVVHLGTFVAIIIYFWNDVVELFLALFGFLRLIKRKSYKKEYQYLIGYIIIASIPAVFVGLFFEDAIDFVFRNTWYVGLMMIIVAEYFLLSEMYFKKNKKHKKEVGLKSAIIIGIAQAFALIPGVSRSGSTIATGLFTNISREKAARFSFLMALPVILGAGLLTFVKEFKAGTFEVDASPMLIGFLSAAISGYFAVYFLMKFLKAHTLKAFSIYLFIVGGLTLIISLAF